MRRSDARSSRRYGTRCWSRRGVIAGRNNTRDPDRQFVFQELSRRAILHILVPRAPMVRPAAPVDAWKARICNALPVPHACSCEAGLQLAGSSMEAPAGKSSCGTNRIHCRLSRLAQSPTAGTRPHQPSASPQCTFSCLRRNIRMKGAKVARTAIEPLGGGCSPMLPMPACRSFNRRSGRHLARRILMSKWVRPSTIR